MTAGAEGATGAAAPAREARDVLRERVTRLRADVFGLIESARGDDEGDYVAVLASLQSVANQLGAAQRALVEPPANTDDDET